MKTKWLGIKRVGKLPKAPGVYFFRRKGKGVLYIGKAANLKSRVKSHFSRPGFSGAFFLKEADKLGYIETASEIEALILEASLIKKRRPKYNVVWRDDKNYFYVAVTKEDFPRVFITHRTNQNASLIGPFVEGNALKKTLRILRRIFPYYTQNKHPKTYCLWCQMGLCPGPNPNKKRYKEEVNNLIAVLRGRKKSVLRNLRKQMKKYASSQNFEQAAGTRDQIKVLEEVFANAKVFNWQTDLNHQEKEIWERTEGRIKTIFGIKRAVQRIEAYDISNIQGQQATGSMVVFIEGKPAKKFYRKFKIKISGKANDTAMIRETLLRRFQHKEWGWPDLILIDGGKPQLSSALKVIKDLRIKNLRCAALAKKKNELFFEGKRSPLLLKNLHQEVSSLMLHLRDEAHRFAIAYHKKLRKRQVFK